METVATRDNHYTSYQQDERSHTTLVAFGYITAVLLPLVGFVIGIVVATRPSRAARHGARIIILSVTVVLVSFILVLGAIRDSTNSAVQSFNQTMQTVQANEQQAQQTLTQQECQADPSLSFCGGR